MKRIVFRRYLREVERKNEYGSYDSSLLQLQSMRLSSGR